MRFQVQILRTGPRAQERVAAALDDGLIEEPDLTPAFVQGIADETQVRQLAELGLRVNVMERIEDEADPGRKARDVSVRRAGVAVRRGAAAAVGTARRGPPTAVGTRTLPAELRDGYYLMGLNGLLTRDVRDRLAAGGAKVLERLPDGRWSVRLVGSPAAIRADRAVRTFVEQAAVGRAEGRTARAVGIRRPAEEKTPRREDPTGVYVAILQPDVDPEQAAREMSEAGADALTLSGREVRFVAAPQSLRAIEGVTGVATVTPQGAPRLLHDMARPLIGIFAGVHDRPDGLDGTGELVGVADTGLDVHHPDFAGRIQDVIARGRPGDGTDPNGHGTHVTGTIAGDGAASGGQLAGVAPRARIFFQSLLDANDSLGGLPKDVGELFQEAYDAGVRVHNNSWGIFLNARYSGPSLSVDAFVWSHPDFLPVIAAGNDGSCQPGLNAGGPGLVDLPSMGVPATAKNALVVGASRSSRTTLGYARLTYGQTWPDSFDAPPIADAMVSGDPSCLAGFSARGPTDDWRIKPDVVAPGTDIASTKSADAPYRNFWGSFPRNDHYAIMGGTSMACPMVAGLAVLVRQYYRQIRAHHPSSALIRATVINGARPLSGSDAVAAPSGDPNFHQGFGRVDFSRTVPAGDADFALSFVDSCGSPDLRIPDSGDMVDFSLDVTKDGDVRLCLAWTDPEGRALQNSLLVTVETPAGHTIVSNPDIARTFSFPGALPARPSPSTFVRDPNNNVHVLRIPAAPAGRYFVTVASLDLIKPQDFALVATGPVGPFSRI